MLKTASICAAVCTLLAAGACSVSAPLTPTSPATTATSPAGSTLKAGAPTLVSPINDVTLANARPTMVITAASGQFVDRTFSYEFQLLSDSGTLVRSVTQASTTWAFPEDLTFDTAYRWQARATLEGAVGAWSATGRFRTQKSPLPAAGVGSSDDAFKAYFFAVIALRGVGPNASAQALGIMEPDLKAVGIILEKASGGEIRGRIYLPTGNPNNLYARAVDIGDFGRPWQWVVRGAATKCEGICQ